MRPSFHSGERAEPEPSDFHSQADQGIGLPNQLALSMENSRPGNGLCFFLDEVPLQVFPGVVAYHQLHEHFPRQEKLSVDSDHRGARKAFS